MTVELWAIGKTKDVWLAEGIASLAKRTGKLATFNYLELPAPRGKHVVAGPDSVLAEAEVVLKRLADADQLILLDERGKTFTSRKFAAYLDALQMRGGSRIVFLIGGAYGFSESLRQRSNGSVRLSDMTFTHQLIRVIALEQFYRGYSILRGLPYHND